MHFFLGGFGPAGDSSSAVGGDGQVVFASSDHSEEAVFSPVGSPGVPSDPVVLASLFIGAPSNNRDFVINHGERQVLRVDATGVFFKVVSY